MANYEFRYATMSGAAIRTTIMQCAADNEAIRQARDTMKDRYVSLEIFEGDRIVWISKAEESAEDRAH